MYEIPKYDSYLNTLTVCRHCLRCFIKTNISSIKIFEINLKIIYKRNAHLCLLIELLLLFNIYLAF
jgi:hypothetical protein